jgi:translation initiation factor 2B subunit (eIF-2B alpha/beta/delta family)
MPELPAEFARRVARLAEDRESGASEILAAPLTLVRDAREAGAPLGPIVRAHPSMASLWNAALEALARSRRIQVDCAEGRPRLEGRRLASRFSAAGVPVRFFSDAAIGHALPGADAVMVGADAISPQWFLNKSGTRMLAAAAHLQGVPTYVIATRDKFIGPAVAEQVTLLEGPASEIWENPPTGVEVRNPYFEPVPLELATTVISDVGVLGAAMVADVCEAAEDAVILHALDELTRS